MADDAAEIPAEDAATEDLLLRMRKRQQESYQRLVEQQIKAAKRFGEISNEIFDDILGVEKKT